MTRAIICVSTETSLWLMKASALSLVEGHMCVNHEEPPLDLSSEQGDATAGDANTAPRASQML